MTENKAPDLDLEFEEVTNPEPDSSPEPVVPEKYKGKSVMELIEMHRNAEKKISQQGQDLAEQRRLSDEILSLRKENASAPEPVTRVTPDDVFSDPNTAVERILGQSDVSKQVKETANRLDSIEKGLGQKDFEDRNPSYMEDIQTEDFVNWVKGNRSRTELLMRLNNYDFQAGNDLWDMWREHQSVAKESKKKETVRAARTVKSGPADTSANKPVYSRAKLLALQAAALRGDPDARAKWENPAFQAEYHSAYAEGRVR